MVRPSMTSPIPVVIDTDIGSDPDDALALLLALASPEIDVRGVTIVSGDIALRARIAARLLGLAGRPDIPIFAGREERPGEPSVMDGAEGRGILDAPWDGPEAQVHAIPAYEWLTAESRARPFHLIAIGPLTNIAAALATDPTFAARLTGLTIMGGLLDLHAMPEAWRHAVAERGMAAWPDYNTMTDAAAALAVAKAGGPVTWVMLDATMRAPLRQASRRLFPTGRPLGAALGHAIDAWHAAWFPAALPSPYDRAPVPVDAVALLHDPLAVASVFSGNESGIFARQTHLACTVEHGAFRLQEMRDGTPATVIDRVDGERFERFFLSRLAAFIATGPCAR